MVAHREEVNALDDTAVGGSDRGRRGDDGRRSLYPAHPGHPFTSLNVRPDRHR